MGGGLPSSLNSNSCGVLGELSVVAKADSCGEVFMTSRVIIRSIVVAAFLVVPAAAYAQEAVLSGTITDSTGAVLPGVALKAVHEASGNSFEGVTDQRGVYRVPVRIGVYQITAELSGFTAVTRSGLQLLVGQTAVINLQMDPGTVTEAVTVTGQSPLLETTTS